MKSFRENPDGEENQRATRENDAYVKSLQVAPLLTAWFTLGQSHVHFVNNVRFDKDCVVKITSTDPRQTMFETFGTAWSMQYDEEPEMRFFPRGVFEL